MTLKATFPQRLLKVDDLIRCNHTYLSQGDECYFLGEYTAGSEYPFSTTNQLVWNLKKPMERCGLPEWHYKGEAILEAAAALRTALEPMGQQILSGMTFVPVPPSKAKADPLYDDRLVQVLKGIRSAPQLDVREIIVQRCSTDPAHSSSVRPRPEQIKAMYEIDEGLTGPEPSFIVVVDDVLTTGAHFRAAQTVLSSRFPAAKVVGLFIARRVPDSSDFGDVEV